MPSPPPPTSAAAPSAATAERSGSGNAVGAVVAQFTQAAGSFVLALLVSRLIGIEGLGSYALIYGFYVVVAGVTSGLVADSLTVLDRSDPAVRAALQRWMMIATTISIVALFVGASSTDDFDAAAGVVVAVTGGVFMAEDVLRRSLMAMMRFWSIVLVDLASFATSIGLVVAMHLRGDDLAVVDVIVALGIGQAVGVGVAIARLPGGERWIAPNRPAEMRFVWNYGAWRAAQQTLRPGMVAVVRVIVTAFVSLTAFGELEAARLFVAPAMLTVGGLAGYLFSSYAADPAAPLNAVRRRADRAVVGLVVLTGVGGVIATVLSPELGRIIRPDEGTLSMLAVGGWAAYASATAAVTPYGSLAAVRGRQAAVFGVRVAESAASIGIVVVWLAADLTVYAVPVLLAIVAALSGVTLRLWLLRDSTSPPTEPPIGSRPGDDD